MSFLERRPAQSRQNVDDFSQNRFARTKARTKVEPGKPTCVKPGRKKKKFGKH